MHSFPRFSLKALSTTAIIAVVLPAVFWLNFANAAETQWIDFNKNGRLDIYEDRSQPVENRIDDLLSQMNNDEKTCQLVTLYGYGRVLKDPLPTAAWKNEVWKDGLANIDEMHNGIGPAGLTEYNATPSATATALNTIQRWFIEETRLGIPVDFTDEGIRGVNYVRSTNFPCNLALGATWDRDLLSRIGDVVGTEGRAVGYTNIYAPIMDLARDPRWGRTVETYGEDPYLVAEMGIRMARAIQATGASATAKHFAVYSEPKGGRDGAARTDPHVAPREMEALHLRPWERLIKETGLRGFMSSYNDYDGVPISGSHEFLIDRARTQWGFKGYVVSDSDAVVFLQSKHHIVATYGEAAAMFIREGGNVRTAFNPPETFLKALRGEIAAGRLSIEVVNARVRDVLRVKFEAGIFDHPYVEKPAMANEIVHSKAHQAVALEAARKCIVLLKNKENVLPLSTDLKRVLVCGPTAKITETSQDRYGSNRGTVISAWEGIQTRLARTGVKLVFSEGCKVVDKRWPESEIFPEVPAGDEASQIAEAVGLARSADAVIVCLGDSDDTIGEGKSRTSLDLPGYQTALFEALVHTGKPVIAVLMCGRPATVNHVQRDAAAILSAWFPGEFGGTAIAEVLFGDVNPSGKLTVTFPRSVGQVPFNFPYKPASQAGQSRREDPNGFGRSSIEGVLYPFGFGLSYTKFSYSDIKVSPASIAADGEVGITCKITNTGSRAGDEVVQLYFRDEISSVTTYTLNLAGFERVSLQPGETKTVAFKLPARDLALIDRAGRRVVEPGRFTVCLGASSTDLRLNGSFEVVAAK